MKPDTELLSPSPTITGARIALGAVTLIVTPPTTPLTTATLENNNNVNNGEIISGPVASFSPVLQYVVRAVPLVGQSRATAASAAAVVVGEGVLAAPAPQSFEFRTAPTALVTVPVSNVVKILARSDATSDRFNRPKNRMISHCAMFLLQYLSPQVPFVFYVAAVTAAGVGAFSDPSAAYRSTGVLPGAPTITGVAAGNGAASVDFDIATSATTATDGSGDAVAYDGGARIYKYVVQAFPSGAIGEGASSPVTVTGLTNGVEYTFRVRAVTSVGAGLFSAASSPVAPSSLRPGMPVLGAVVAGTRALTVQFGMSPVAATSSGLGGGGVVQYEVTTIPDGLVASAFSSPIVVRGLRNGVTYAVTLAAVNAFGPSARVNSAATG